LSSKAQDRSMLQAIHDALAAADPARGSVYAANQRRDNLDADANRTLTSGCKTSARTH
jgi:hypothetical protein